MISPDTQLFCHPSHPMLSPEQEQQRLRSLDELGVLETESVPIFDEATQTAAHFLDAPICVLGFLSSDRQWFKSAVGLSRIGLMNELATSRQLLRHESFGAYVVEHQQILAINDAAADPAVASSQLVQRYGIRSYLGVPLIDSKGFYLGTLEVMGLTPRTFTRQEIDILQLIARWSISEFERNQLLRTVGTALSSPTPAQASHRNDRLPSSNSSPISHASVKVRLLSQMTQELCTPLTSILGMARVLSQGIYGTLTDKQKEYIEIIHNSGQHLLSLVNEVMELGALDDADAHLNLNAVDIEMLCQQVVGALKQTAQRFEQQIKLTVPEKHRIWLLDKDKVRQLLYHLVFSVMQSSSPDSVIRIHVSRKQNCLNLMIWTSHRWLGDGLAQAEFMPSPVLSQLTTVNGGWGNQVALSNSTWRDQDYDRSYEDEAIALELEDEDPAQADGSRQSLGLMLSRQLAEIHGGSVTIQGSPEEGYRYVVKLPEFNRPES